MASIQVCFNSVMGEIFKLRRENNLQLEFIQSMASLSLKGLSTTERAVFEEKHTNFIKNINRNRNRGD